MDKYYRDTEWLPTVVLHSEETTKYLSSLDEEILTEGDVGVKHMATAVVYMYNILKDTNLLDNPKVLH